ncbi:hypothetical protein IP92_03432 [Pseudoduganella flava]|uniref:Uncharacterized protein n=1 Tax=Pseudoduganella flava TaxID=871742 RepID=A0A562PNL4_9BURK|nr:hypothetical protein [Pseudoduganella flava]QGZ40554.1 hypothetical protein GO485_16810 [Pseudoduganella flava]TWI45999.1 hypothetical protein IP92_03432 [Pseudoduganella flava]
MQPTNEIHSLYRSAFDDLPSDQYGVLVENEVDAIRLKWLASVVGENKLRGSVAKYHVRYPDCKPYVSLLLKWYHLKVPVKLYAAVPVPVYWVYILRMQCEPKIKIGMTGRWPFRVWDFVRKANQHDADRDRLASTFDLHASQAWLVGGNKSEAIRREAILKDALFVWQVESPWKSGHTNYGAGGHKEWFDSSQMPLAIELMASFDGAAAAGQTLREALEIASQSVNPDLL